MEQSYHRKHLTKIRNTLVKLKGLKFEENHRDELINDIHYSIISGEGYQFTLNKEIETCFDEIQAGIKSLDAGADNIQGLISSFDAYKALCQFIFSNIHEYYNADGNRKKKPFHFHNISSVLDIKPLKATTHKYSEKKETLTLDIKAHTVIVKLNVLVAELDFSLSCSNNYLSDAIEIYAMLEAWHKCILNNKVNAKVVNILKSKCSLLLAKSLYQRGDLMESIRYYGYGLDSYATKNAHQFNEEAKEHFSPFIDKRNFVPLFSHTESDDDINLITKEYNGRSSDFEIKIKVFNRDTELDINDIDFSDLHFICGYLLHVDKTQLELLTKFRYINTLRKAISKIYNKSDYSAFDRNAICSLLNLIENTKLNLIANKLDEHCRNNNGLKARRYYSLLQKTYTQTSGRKPYRDNTNEYFRHYLYLNGNLAMCKFYIRRANDIYRRLPSMNKTALAETLKLYGTLIDSDLKETTGRLIEGLRLYSTRLKNAERNKHIMLFLPEAQCRIHSVAHGLDYFICSSYLSPTNYHSERTNLSNIQIDIENTLTKVLFAFYEYGSAALNQAGSKISKHIETLQLEATHIKEEALKLKTQIDTDLIKTKDVLQIGFQDTKDDIKERLNETIRDVRDEVNNVRTSTIEQIQSNKKEVDASISTNNTKSIAYLGLFTAIISIFVSSWQSSKIFEDVDNLMLVNFSVSAILIVFVIVLSLLTFEFKIKERKTDAARAIALVVLLGCSIYMAYEIYYGLHKKVTVQKNMQNSVDSMRSELDYLKSQIKSQYDTSHTILKKRPIK